MSNPYKHINDRSMTILKVIVERYIRDGQPVGSKAIAEETTMALSSATIRNIMADLEEAGYLHSPHTSAGRVPTSQGYRLFVNNLLTVRPLADVQLREWRKKLNPETEPSALVETASTMLSTITQLAGLVTVPKREHFALTHIEFLPLSGNRVLTILVFNGREVQNRIIHTHRAYTASELQQAGNFLTQTYAGKDLTEIRQELLHLMHQDQTHLQTIMQTVNEIADKAFLNETTSDYVMAGAANLVSLAEAAGIDRLQSLLTALTQKRDILHLFDACSSASGIQIFIGQESGYQVLDDCSLVTAPYSVDDKVIGVLGVIGPTRMAYERVISVVDMTAKLLSAALSDSH